MPYFPCYDTKSSACYFLKEIIQMCDPKNAVGASESHLYFVIFLSPKGLPGHYPKLPIIYMRESPEGARASIWRLVGMDCKSVGQY